MIRFSQYLPVNTGQLVALRRKGKVLHLVIVEPNASSHVFPTHPLSCEAIRIYGDYTHRDIRRAWVMWSAQLLGYQMPNVLHLDSAIEKQARQYIEENLDKIPEI